MLNGSCNAMNQALQIILLTGINAPASGHLGYTMWVQSHPFAGTALDGGMGWDLCRCQ